LSKWAREDEQSIADEIPGAQIGSIGLRIAYQKIAVVRLDEAGRFAGFADKEEVGVLAINGPNVFAGGAHAVRDEGLWLTSEGERWLARISERATHPNVITVFLGRPYPCPLFVLDIL
jgi:hypothetical protein